MSHPESIPETFRFRSALKLSKLNAGYSICTLSDDADPGNPVHVNCYSQTLCKIVYDEPIQETTMANLSQNVRDKRGSQDKNERSLFFSELLRVWLSEKEPVVVEASPKSSQPTAAPAPAPPPTTSPSHTPPTPPTPPMPPSPPRKSKEEELRETLAAARSHFEASKFADCVESCLFAVKLCRSLPSPASSSASTASDIANAYSLMGDSYVALGAKKHGRAISCYTLSVKNEDNQKVRDKVAKLKVNAEGDPASVEEIEALVQNHKVLGVKDSFNFHCTGCGECCRTADNILLTPYDLFNMTRTPNLVSEGAGKTFELRQHEKYKKALKYMLKDETPICYLRPVKSETGRCQFSFEMHKRGGKLMNFQETMAMEEEYSRPVTSDEYNLTEEEELEALKDCDLSNSGGSSSENSWEESSNSSRSSEDYETDAVRPVYSSYGKPALSCMLGMKGMPAMCAAYPMANEMTWGDFWHARDEKQDTLLYDERPRGSQQIPDKRFGKLSDSWLFREKFMVVANDVCEGFFPPGKPRTLAYSPPPPSSSPPTISDFLDPEGSTTDLGRKEIEKSWFLTLHSTATSAASTLHSTNPTVHKLFVENLARVWFNFDTLRPARSRPFKSWARLKKVIEEDTRVLIEQTKRFVELEEERKAKGAGGGGAGGEENAEQRFRALLVRLAL
ncbi:hypothetical protein TrST_g14094 [Triparma strigata]|uniref:Uncharacterized protein n=1 Tax=Triparma strigata TaxID=1606541 RepID=A0A9W7E5T3_9STRA|nr:hypothetical protein TrST_g14094 [Triparma strigata]